MAKTGKVRKSSPWRDVFHRLKRNKMAMLGLMVLSLVPIMAIFAPWIAPYDYAEQMPEAARTWPNAEHLLGTDNFGRDILSRIIVGSRYTLMIGFGCITIACVIGTVLGALAGFYKRLDNWIMRATDIIMGIPTFMLCISIIAALGTGIKTMMLALCITSIPAFIRIVRAQVLTIKDQEYVEAARSIGAGNFRIMTKHILPNAMAPIIVQYTLGAVNLILWAASLSFLGMGVQPPTPEWGLMVSAGRQYLYSEWYMSLIPGLAIIITTYALNLLGDGLRDALDPRLKQ